MVGAPGVFGESAIAGAAPAVTPTTPITAAVTTAPQDPINDRTSLG